MSKVSKRFVVIVTLLLISLAVIASAFYEKRANSVPLPSDGRSLLNLSNDNAASIPASTPPMPPPVAYFSISTEAVSEGIPITFDASFSYDPFGQITSYEWNFGDVSKEEGKIVTHSYSASGKYEAELTVTGTLEMSSSFSKQILVEQKDMLEDIGDEFRQVTMPAERNALLQNFPNPFNPETWIPYHLKEGSDVTIQIYDAGGSLVRQLDLGYKPAGFYADKSKAAYWDGRNEAGENVSSGIYFYNIQAGEYTAMRKMIVAH